MIAIADLIVDKKYYHLDEKLQHPCFYIGTITHPNHEPTWWNTCGYTIYYQFRLLDNKIIEVTYFYLRQHFVAEEDFIHTIEDIY